VTVFHQRRTLLDRARDVGARLADARKRLHVSTQAFEEQLRTLGYGMTAAVPIGDDAELRFARTKAGSWHLVVVRGDQVQQVEHACVADRIAAAHASLDLLARLVEVAERDVGVVDGGLAVVEEAREHAQALVEERSR
jgi:hypothetical protein